MDIGDIMKKFKDEHIQDLIIGNPADAVSFIDVIKTGHEVFLKILAPRGETDRKLLTRILKGEFDESELRDMIKKALRDLGHNEYP
jgi:hypothetical protein